VTKTTIGQTLDFGLDGNAVEFQLDGWSGAEPRFTWSIGMESALAIHRPVAPHGFFIEIKSNSFIRAPEPLTQTLEFILDGNPVARASVDHHAVIAVFVPPRDPEAGEPEAGTAHLLIRHPNATSPEPGARALAVSFHTLRILTIDEPQPYHVPISVAVEWSERSSKENLESILGISARELVSEFEMLAGNCEFGGMQRACGAEPLSLLRFAGALAMVAMDGLDSDFEGIGESIEPFIVENQIREWMIRDHRYHLAYHSMASSNQVSAEEVVEREKRKIAFLKRKFLEDLTESNKIFVCSDRHINTKEEAVALFLALRRKSKRQMIWVTASEKTGKEPGTVVEILPGLMVGHIDRFAPAHNGSDVSIGGWLTVLAKAWLLAKRPDGPSTPIPSTFDSGG
jgi:hypothetical protein